MPAKVLGLINKGSLSEGADADITVLDLEKKYNIDVNKFESKSKNSPFNGRAVKGAAFMTIVGGEIKMKEGKVL